MGLKVVNLRYVMTFTSSNRVYSKLISAFRIIVNCQFCCSVSRRWHWRFKYTNGPSNLLYIVKVRRAVRIPNTHMKIIVYILLYV